ncbi:MAG TPA: hypothetical protein DEA82_09155 [Flavobacteriaceae bacterium]|jgi:hypothetical protein|nr:hypothetical protein [Flavobacteriaceae bacterium]HBR54332.1 hypothetical protein [Flavobacteriaceae bacterium]|tara:strand:- start:39 stop:395 length:357 start_codon:yes stop_codon:yes gene_type:complete
MKFFRNVVSNIILVAAISFATGVAAFPSETLAASSPVSTIDSVTTPLNDHSLFLEEISVAELAPVFDKNQLQYHSVHGNSENSVCRSVNVTEAVLLCTFIDHKNKHLVSLLFPVHSFW